MDYYAVIGNDGVMQFATNCMELEGCKYFKLISQRKKDKYQMILLFYKIKGDKEGNRWYQIITNP